MALLNGTEAKAGPAPASKTDDEAARLKKNEASRKHAEKVKAAKEADYQNALKLRDNLTKSGAFNALPKETQEWVLAKCVDPAVAAVGGSTTSTFTQLFGSAPKVGDKITLKAAVEKLNYRVGFKDLNAKAKLWADKGTVVECVINKDKMLESEYVIRKLPA